MRGILITAWAIFLGSFLFTQTALASPISSVKIIELTNQARKEHGLFPLSYSFQLSQAAQNKAESMVKSGYFAHEDKNGKSAWDFIQEADYNFKYAGENLASNFKTSEKVFLAFMESKNHREVILNPKYEDIGVGISENKVVCFYGKPILGFSFPSLIEKVYAKTLFNSKLNSSHFIPILSNIFFPTMFILLDGFKF